jgi:hypothetical protein
MAVKPRKFSDLRGFVFDDGGSAGFVGASEAGFVFCIVRSLDAGSRRAPRCT